MNDLERQTLAKVRGLASANRIIFTAHAIIRMNERNVLRRDVHRALSGGRECKDRRDGTFRVTGKDFDGDDLTCAVAIDTSISVITVF